MDIGSNNGYPAGNLSNFHAHPFVFREIPVTSMEGFLQGLKFKNPEMQKHVFTLMGRVAKFKGKKKKWWREQTLWFQGNPIKRESDEYQELLDEVYEAMFTQNEKAKKALLATNRAVLTHSMGKKDKSKTVLTEREFVRRLHRMRTKLQKEEKKKCLSSKRSKN